MEKSIPGTFKPNNKGTKILSDNPIIERLTRTHIAVPLSIFTAYSACLLYWAFVNTSLNWGSIIGVFFLGWFAFTLVEYIMHRYLFHMATDTRVKEKMQYVFHGVHHEFPRDKDRLAMPPWASITIATALLFAFKLIMGDYSFAFTPGFIMGYTMYLFVHFAVHAFQPPKNFLKVLWIHHGIHHYKDHERAYGVSSPLWDYIFGTIPQRNKN